MTDLLQLLIVVLAVAGVVCILFGAAQITWDAVHQHAKRKRTTRGNP